MHQLSLLYHLQQIRGLSPLHCEYFPQTQRPFRWVTAVDFQKRVKYLNALVLT